jgi:NADH-quinone oxidoreductase subunit M
VIVVLATISLVLGGLYSLILIYKALFGDNTAPKLAKENGGRLRDLGKRELSLLSVLAIGLVWLGLYPQPVLNTSDSAMSWIAKAYADELPTKHHTPHGIADHVHGHHHHGHHYHHGHAHHEHNHDEHDHSKHGN